MTKLLPPRLVAIVELAVALWLAATSGYLCLQLGVPQPVQLAGGQLQPRPAGCRPAAMFRRALVHLHYVECSACRRRRRRRQPDV
ncbi:hypothetical protein GUJ93_ZPchr0006g41812 [Zizania palustris]|uniref:Uncharacterized protein n=1 Tax=Zizania palustris TaxID=103762 RepID=A0A8J5SJB9_ZIZPA|nr:hypothetical protein GUJ93_ZPchr0006g41812 [Zizania palustris]